MDDQIVRIDMATQTVTSRPLANEAAALGPLPVDAVFLGGRALTSLLVAAEVPPDCQPLGRRNKLVLACGALAGTRLSSANRLSMGAKSPLTGTIKESNAGGSAAWLMGRLGLRALVLENLPPSRNVWYIVHASAAGVRVLPAPEGLAGAGTRAKAEQLFGIYGRKAGLIVIGPVGERRLHTAGVAATDPEGEPSRYCGRGGLGAVMGSKGVLAIVLDPTDVTQPALADKSRFLTLQRELAQRINTTPITAEGFRKYGTAGMLDITQALGALPTRNFSAGRFEGVESMGSQALHDTILARGGEGSISHACMPGCLIQCSNIFPDAEGRKLCSPVEYENLGLLGSNLGLANLDDIACLNALCNDVGCDTIEMGAALGVAMEAGLASFGDAKAALSLLRDVESGTALGRVLASGAGVTGTVFGVSRVPVVKNQALPAYDPRAIKGVGVTYATSPQGADHTAGNTARAKIRQNEAEGQVALSRGAQHRMTLLDALGVCMMLAGVATDAQLADLLVARHGVPVDAEALAALGRQVLTVEHDFNSRAGFTDAHDRLPEFFVDERNPDSDSVFDITPEAMQAVRA